MGLIGVIYGPVIMILLVTSIEVYTKYMLRTDLEVLAERGDIDLEELGLAPGEEEGKGERIARERFEGSRRAVPAGTPRPGECAASVGFLRFRGIS